jgi:hypothetical protein
VAKTATDVPPDFGLLDEAEVRELVWPLVSGGAAPGSDVTVTVHRLREDGRAVAEYELGGGRRVFAKLYPDAETGRRVFAVHRDLSEHGFGDGSSHRVPAPLAYLEDRCILLLGPAAGERLAEMKAQGGATYEEAVVRAAGWLAALHASRVGSVRYESVVDGLSRLTRRVTKAIAARPDLADVVRSALGELERRGRPGVSEARVPTHGRFHGGHVFVSSECVTAVDLDRFARADPAKDVAEYIHGVRSIGAQTGVVDDAVEDECVLFVDQYLRAGGRRLDALEFYWSYSVLWTLLGLALKNRPARRGWQVRLDFFRREFDAVPERAAALLG